MILGVVQDRAPSSGRSRRRSCRRTPRSQLRRRSCTTPSCRSGSSTGTRCSSRSRTSIATLFTSSLLGYVFAKYEFRGAPGAVLVRARDDDDPGAGHDDPRLPDPRAARPAQQPVGARAAGVHRRVRHLPDAPVHAVDPRRRDLVGARRRRLGVAHLPLGGAAAAQARARHARHADVHVPLERLPVAADRAHRAGQADPADHPHLVLDPAQLAAQPGDGGLGADGDPGAHRLRRCRSAGSCAA